MNHPLAPFFSTTQLPILLWDESLWDKPQVFRQGARNRHFKQRTGTIRIDDQSSARSKERPDLALPFNGRERHRRRAANVGQERVRVLAKAHSQRKGQVIAEGDHLPA